ncbi:MAG TPA: aspartate carbamoyltransferase catalytic subunit [Candidatus Kapabacteria bacterium]|nr:aspartate carbamoyltransferase catalytic subunit [Candidatus Kapabacteria bacterium]
MRDRMHRNLLGIRGLAREDIQRILSRSSHYIKQLDSSDAVTFPELLKGRTVANLFFENSTRTRSSFELAERRLGATILSLSMQTSSLTKGETLLDTAKVITSMKIDAIVVRHQSSGVPILLRKHLDANIRIINAGDGAGEHPTQALLDAATLIEQWGSLEGKHIVISGDIRHSRVARSNILLLKQLGAKITVSGPTTLIPENFDKVFGVNVEHNFEQALRSADALIALRIQRERQDKAFYPNAEEFRNLYGMTAVRREKFPKLLVLHPGPVNRGVELDDVPMDGEGSLVFRQVRRGVAIRMAVLEWMFSTD